MKFIISLLSLILMNSAFSANITCTNTDDYWEEDTLEFNQEGNTTYAYYFDNDSTYSIPCQATALDGLICEENGLRVRLYESGEAVVDSGSEEVVNFSCN
ncbi:MAG: hypothetical protein K9K67_15250 [Bacteriovoracaceae bacterium]|nr:hypothetical protein [Bacteriovoracaceae bacterium]